MSKLIKRECPNCGATIKFDSKLQVIKCEYCDTEFESPVSKDQYIIPYLLHSIMGLLHSTMGIKRAGAKE